MAVAGRPQPAAPAGQCRDVGRAKRSAERRSSTGLATAAHVFADTAAVAEGTYAGLTGTLSLTVRNTGDDDLGLYAGDGLIDLWQVEHFGLEIRSLLRLRTLTAMASTTSVSGWR